MDDLEPLWEFLKQQGPSGPDGSLASRTLARLAVEKIRRRRWMRLGRAFALSVLFMVGGGSAAFWWSNQKQRVATSVTHPASFSIETNPAAEDVGWLQDQLSPESSEMGATILWEEENSF
ncbi:hypothetical protein MAMC_01990 [Methylacidimicrobium cyclopophantes]|uniref:Uncharacterized protein n=1 Tax=Methylacidimicrobium cyclopophantes TaxID=1041766 RepID=A0A5E6MF81_9BACT|nr:hypothetical protein [Methylacidimicrobium cyclopophantes]VVM08147.1 hypothetical protein MAMC_01990 [Methylacidimicrobium cyclopophantes]